MFDNNITSMREAFGSALLELGQKNHNVVALCADVAESTQVNLFAEKYPHRFFDVGVAEQNLVGIASGMALTGKIPFAASYAAFLVGRALDQIRISVAYNNANVKLIGSHGGITVGEDGATHQMLEDITIMRSIPNMTVIVPADARQAYLSTLATAEHKGPVYLRLSRAPAKPITKQEDEFIIGKADVLLEGDDIAIISCGIMVYRALTAAMRLRREGIQAAVINCHTIKPLDKETILDKTRNVRGVVVTEEGQAAGGLGAAVAELLSKKNPKFIRSVAIKDKFGESGSADELRGKYHLTTSDIVEASLKVFRRISD